MQRPLPISRSHTKVPQLLLMQESLKRAEAILASTDEELKNKLRTCVKKSFKKIRNIALVFFALRPPS